MQDTESDNLMTNTGDTYIRVSQTLLKFAPADGLQVESLYGWGVCSEVE